MSQRRYYLLLLNLLLMEAQRPGNIFVCSSRKKSITTPWKVTGNSLEEEAGRFIKFWSRGAPKGE